MILYRRQGARFGELGMRPEGYALAQEASTTADAVCMYAQMLNELLVKRGVPLEDLARRTATAYELVQEVFARTDFDGVQGRLSYEPGSAEGFPFREHYSVYIDTYICIGACAA